GWIACQAGVAIDAVDSQRAQTDAVDAMIEKVNARIAFVRAFEDAVMRRGFARRGLVERDVIIIHSVDRRRARVNNSVDANLSSSLEDVERAGDVHERTGNGVGLACWNLQTRQMDHA